MLRPRGRKGSQRVRVDLAAEQQQGLFVWGIGNREEN